MDYFYSAIMVYFYSVRDDFRPITANSAKNGNECGSTAREAVCRLRLKTRHSNTSLCKSQSHKAEFNYQGGTMSFSRAHAIRCPCARCHGR